jgi:hypothetical protein
MELSTLESGGLIKPMDMENSYTPMERPMKANGLKTKQMALENMFIRMVQYTQGNG